LIGLKGQYLFSFSIAGKNDFIQEADLQLFKVVEDAGNILPSFEFVFTLEDTSILRYLNEGNPLEMAMGEDDIAMTNINFRILNKQISKISQHKYLIRLTGLYDDMSYYTDCRINITDKVSGIEAIIDTAENHFGIDTNVTKSQDQQYWVQSNVSNKMFINQVWMHSWLVNSFPAIGITSDGIFVIRDVKKLIKKLTTEDYAWKFISTDSTKPDELTFDQYKVESNTGFINLWVGYEREKEVLNLDTGVEGVITPSLNTMLSLSTDLDRMADIGTRASEFGVVNENVHPKYWVAYQQNLSYLSIFGSTKIVLQFTGKYANIRVLDLVLLRDMDLELKQSEEYYSGAYLVTRVTRILENKNFITMIHLNRESLGGLQGEFA